MRTFISDIYKDISYILDDDGYATADYQDLTRKRFIKAWEGLVDGYKVIFIQTHVCAMLHNFVQDTFSEGNYRLFIGLALDVLLRPWEKFVMSLKYTEVGLRHFGSSLILKEHSWELCALIVICVQS